MYWSRWQTVGLGGGLCTCLRVSACVCVSGFCFGLRDKGNIVFFSLIDAKGENFITALLHSRGTFRLTIDKTPYSLASKAPSPTVFPEQWLRSCFSVETVTGQIKWVVDGQVVEDKIFQEVNERVYDEMKEVKGKVQLGQAWWPGGGWSSSNNKVSALNIFSSALSLKEMQKMTSESIEDCGKEGDFFAWKTWSGP